MKLSRSLALLLAAISACFLTFATLNEEIGGLTLGLLAAGSLIVGASGLTRSRTALSRWLLVTASLIFSMLVLAALAMQFEQQSSLLVRSGLSALLMLGLLLCLRCCYQLKRTTRYGFHNYYDAPR